MPSRNVYKDYVAESYYHIYNRGVNRRAIFTNNHDYTVFLGLLKRYLGKDAERKPNRTYHPNFYRQSELLAFCLMKNHFHLFIYQHEETVIAQLMKSLSVAYSMYFNQ